MEVWRIYTFVSSWFQCAIKVKKGFNFGLLAESDHSEYWSSLILGSSEERCWNIVLTSNDTVLVATPLPPVTWSEKFGSCAHHQQSPKALQGGRNDEACDVFATNANVPEDGEGHHAVEKAANLQWVGESVASERIPSMWESWSEECGDEVWRGTLPCSANLSQGMVTHIGMAIDTLFCKEPEVTDWSKTKNALTRLGLNTTLQDSKRWAIDRDRPSRILCQFF